MDRNLGTICEGLNCVLQIYRTDPLPKHICESCYLNLSTMFAFRKTSLETFDKQKQRLRTNSTGSSINVRLYLNTLDNENGVVSYTTKKTMN